MARAKYDDDGFRLDPIPARQTDAKNRNHPDVWFYEEQDGLTVVVADADIEAHIPAKRIREWVRIADSVGKRKAEGGGR